MNNNQNKYIFYPFETEISHDNSIWLDSLILDKDGLKLTFRGEACRYIFKFKNTCPFRRVDEADRVGEDKDYVFVNPKNLGCTFIGEKSDFLDALYKYSQWGKNPAAYGKHYLFATENDIVDVISKIPPEISIEKV